MRLFVGESMVLKVQTREWPQVDSLQDIQEVSMKYVFICLDIISSDRLFVTEWNRSACIAPEMLGCNWRYYEVTYIAHWKVIFTANGFVSRYCNLSWIASVWNQPQSIPGHQWLILQTSYPAYNLKVSFPLLPFWIFGSEIKFRRFKFCGEQR